MKRTPVFLVALLAAAALGPGPAALAAEDPMDFIQALQDKGYADVAVDYLNDLKASNELNTEQSKLFDFVMSKCLRSAARDAYNEPLRIKYMEQAKECLARFIKAQPNHPKAMEAIVWWAGFSTDEAMKHLQAAQDPNTSKEMKAAELAATRAALEEAQPRLVQASEKFKEQKEAVRGHRKRDKELRDDLEAKWQNAAFQAILCDYYLAQTYDDPNDSKRREMLEKASKEFDGVFQTNRESDMGLYAHMWQGKTVMELGDDPELAKDIFDEVLPKFELDQNYSFKREDAALYCQVKQFRLELTAKEDTNKFVAEARQWRDYYRRTIPVRQADGYQGISLELAKALLAQAAKATGAEKMKLSTEAVKILDEMVNVPSPYHEVATQLRRSLRGEVRSGEPNNFEDACERGDDALRKKQWNDAIRCYTLALEKAKKLKNATAKVTRVKDAMGSAYFFLAREQYGAGKLPACLETLQTLTETYHESSYAPMGAVLAVNVKFAQYLAIPAAQAKERAKALQEVIDRAKYTTDTWPGKPEADDARMVLGRLYLLGGQIDKTLEQFQAVNPHSERYPTALYLEGYTYWSLYIEEKKKPEAKRDAAAMASNMEKAIQAMATSVQQQRKAWKLSRVAEMPRPLVEAELLLAKIYLEAGDGKKAAAEFQPLIDEVKRSRPKSLDDTMLAIFLGGVRAYVAANDLQRASDAGMLLVDLGPDAEAVNDALLRFAMLLEKERKKAEAAVIGTVDPKENAAARDRLAGMNEMLGRLLTKLASRERVSPLGMVWIAEISSAVGQDAAAEMQCQQFLKRVKIDPSLAKDPTLAKAVTRIRTLLVHILGKTGKFDQALPQIETLIKDHRTALEPRVEECRLRYAWAMKDSEQLIPAQRACEALRSALDRIKGKKPPEYYEVVYYEADCLCAEAEVLDKKTDKAAAAETAKKAEQVLKYSLFNKPDLDGPERVEQYKQVLQRAARLQGVAPAVKKAGK